MALRSVVIWHGGAGCRGDPDGLNKFYNQWLLELNGVFGNETTKVVCRFQEEQGMVPPDGIVGSITRSALFRLVAATVNIWATRRPQRLRHNRPRFHVAWRAKFMGGVTNHFR